MNYSFCISFGCKYKTTDDISTSEVPRVVMKVNKTLFHNIATEYPLCCANSHLISCVCHLLSFLTYDVAAYEITITFCTCVITYRKSL